MYLRLSMWRFRKMEMVLAELIYSMPQNSWKALLLLLEDLEP